jgi:hypothetical protein
MNDVTGKQFRVGDRIAYPQRYGSSTYMRLATITQVIEGNDARLLVKPEPVSPDNVRHWERNRGRLERSYPIRRWDNAVIYERSEQ